MLLSLPSCQSRGLWPGAEDIVLHVWVSRGRRSGGAGDCCVFAPVDWLDVSHGAYITARPAGWEHCLCLSVTYSLFFSPFSQLTTFLSVSLRVCPLHPAARFALRLVPPHFFSPPSAFLTLSPPRTFFVFFLFSSSVMTLANISLQLVGDWAHLYLLYRAECVCVCTYHVRLHVLMTTSLFKNIITDGRNIKAVLYFGWYAFCFLLLSG